MRWGDMRRSENVEDRTAGGGGGFGIGGLPLSGGALILVVIASLLFGVNPLELLGVMGGSGPAPEQRSAPVFPAECQLPDSCATPTGSVEFSIVPSAPCSVTAEG